jgi:zinc transport system ATP-binding protein
MRMNLRPALAMLGGTVAYGANVALDRVDLAVAEGEFVVLLGPNGSGKSTLVRALLGIVTLRGGHVEILGRRLSEFHEWERVGYVPQRPSAATGVPATADEVVLSGRIARSRWVGGHRASDRAAAGHALEMVGLASLADAPVASLSGGQQQRVLIARALVTDPDVLLLDEPLSGVDLDSQEGLVPVLRRLGERGAAILVVAHALGVLEPLVQRAVVLDRGRVVYHGAPRPEDVHGEHPHHHAQVRAEVGSFGRARGAP